MTTTTATAIPTQRTPAETVPSAPVAVCVALGTRLVTTTCGHYVPLDATQTCETDPWDDPHCTDCRGEHAATCGACNQADTDTHDGSWD